MKQSNILLDANIDIKIQRGLKILEFGTQYYLLKAYYRNCPLNTYHEVDQNLSSKAKNAQNIRSKEAADLTAEIMCQLNEQLLNNLHQDKRHVPSIKKPSQKVTILEPSVIFAQNQKSQASIQESIKESEDPSHASLEELSNYVSQKSKAKLQSIKEQKQPSQEQSMIKLQASIISNKSKKPKVQIVQHSKMSVKSNRTQKQGSKVQEISMSAKQASNFKKESVIQSQKSRQQSHDLLNNNISKITSNDSLLGNKQSSKSNISQFELLRQLSQTFVDGQNMKMLLKLQNCELEQRYLQQRIINRLEKGYKDVNRISIISWESLKLPRMNISFKRPNYAHTIQ